MNENELKELWNSEDSKSLPNIDFEQIQKSLNTWHSNLRKKIKLDIVINALFLIILIPVCYILPELIYFIPIVIVGSFLGYWKLWQIYKQETGIENAENSKEFLHKKTYQLASAIKWTRIITYSIVPFLVIASLLVNLTIKQLLEVYVWVIILIVFFEIFAIIFCEVYFRIMYFPSIKTSNELLEQLEEN